MCSIQNFDDYALKCHPKQKGSRWSLKICSLIQIEATSICLLHQKLISLLFITCDDPPPCAAAFVWQSGSKPPSLLQRH